ncbi:MAG: PAS domain-containing protein [Opitutaceae bacterium]|nr:PAS domain-containing protein [Opitutaceae bacterium]
MKETGSNPADATGAIDEADLCPVLVVDASGRVVAANRSARQLWAAPDKFFVGLPFAALFAPGSNSSNSELLERQWKDLSAVVMDNWAPLAAQVVGGPPREVRVRLERAFGGAGSYIAAIQPQLPRVTHR